MTSFPAVIYRVRHKACWRLARPTGKHHITLEVSLFKYSLFHQVSFSFYRVILTTCHLPPPPWLNIGNLCSRGRERVVKSLCFCRGTFLFFVERISWIKNFNIATTFYKFLIFQKIQYIKHKINFIKILLSYNSKYSHFLCQDFIKTWQWRAFHGCVGCNASLVFYFNTLYL